MPPGIESVLEADNGVTAGTTCHQYRIGIVTPLQRLGDTAIPRGSSLYITVTVAECRSRLARDYRDHKKSAPVSRGVHG